MVKVLYCYHKCKINNEIRGNENGRSISFNIKCKDDKAIQTLYNLETSGISYFHIDVMDGKFVKMIQQIKC